MKKNKKNTQPISNPTKKSEIQNPSKSINPIWLIGALAAITFVAYIGAFKNGFVEWDDQHYVTDNQLVLNPTGANFKQLLTQIVALNYHPVTMFSLALNVLFFGKGASSFIIVNVLIHALNTLMVFRFIQKLTDNKTVVSFMTALLFGIHPMHVESVAWIAERKDVLYVFFFLISCICYLNFKEKNQSKWLILSILAFVLSCLCKAMAVPLPIVLLLIDYWYGREWYSVQNLIQKAPFFLIALLFGLISVNVQAGGDFHGLLTKSRSLSALSTTTFSGLERISYPSFGYLKYHIMALLPMGLSNLHPYPGVSEAGDPKYLLGIVFFVASIVVMLWSYRKHKFVFFGWGFFLVTIVLVLQFLSVGKAFMAERYSYLPYIGLFFMIFYGLNQWLKTSMTWMIGGVFGLICFYLTTQQVKVWKDNFSLWSNAYEKYPNDGSILESMADEYGRKGDFANVKIFGEKAIQTGTKSYHTYEIMANIYAINGDLNKSLEMYSKAISIDSTVGNIYFNRGITYSNAKRFQEAVNDFTKSMTKESNEKPFKVRAARGVAYLELGKLKEALEDYDFVIQNAEIQNANYHVDRAVIKFNLQDKNGAIADLQTALKIDPNNQKAKENLAIIQR
jgi:protein O-mannosyl-transferase